MCGFAGFLAPPGSNEAELVALATRMAAPLAPRGPDDAGAWADPAAGIALGFRRLAIIDVTADGRQPMHSASGRYVIAFNGEIYNYRALRRELGADRSTPAFRGRFRHRGPAGGRGALGARRGDLAVCGDVRLRLDFHGNKQD